MKPFKITFTSKAGNTITLMNPTIDMDNQLIHGWDVTPEEFIRVESELNAWYANGCEPPEPERPGPKFAFGDRVLLNGVDERGFSITERKYDEIYNDWKYKGDGSYGWWREKNLQPAEPPEPDHSEGGKYKVFQKGELHPMYKNLKTDMPELQMMSMNGTGWLNSSHGTSTENAMYRIPIETYEADLAAYEHCQSRGLNMKGINS